MTKLHLTMASGRPIAINVNRIDAVVETSFGTNIFVGGANEPFGVKDSYNDIIVKLAEIEVMQ